MMCRLDIANTRHAHLASGNRTSHPSVDKKGNRETVSQLSVMKVNTVNATFPPNREGGGIGDR